MIIRYIGMIAGSNNRKQHTINNCNSNSNKKSVVNNDKNRLVIAVIVA